jgi:hypothetical protein
MAIDETFSDIRPYRDEEVPGVVKRVVKDPAFHTLMAYVYPERNTEEVLARVSRVKTIREFQLHVAYPAMRRIIDQTVKNLSVQGIESLNERENYLFISNHRDIILDSAIMNILLHEAGMETFQTAIGSNLLEEELVRDLTKLNKNFTVIRNTGAREFYENSVRLSAYIHESITRGYSSIWIAQREGRSKDGIDKTQPGLLKMLSINCSSSIEACFEELNLTPVAISYELDPCDILKIPELRALANDLKYVKKPGEDYHSILTGITGEKGNVHLNIGTPLKDDLNVLSTLTNPNEKLKRLGELIDDRIHRSYKLWPSNYIALDLLRENDEHAEYYTQSERKHFEERMHGRLEKAGLTDEQSRALFLNMYANPAKNQVKAKATTT